MSPLDTATSWLALERRCVLAPAQLPPAADVCDFADYIDHVSYLIKYGTKAPALRRKACGTGWTLSRRGATTQAYDVPLGRLDARRPINCSDLVGDLFRSESSGNLHHHFISRWPS